MTPKQFAKVILDAQEIREDNIILGIAVLTHYESVEKAIELNDIDKKYLIPIVLLNKTSWNDIQDWAKETVKHTFQDTIDEVKAIEKRHSQEFLEREKENEQR